MLLSNQRYNQNRGTLTEARERLRKLTGEKDKLINDIQVGGRATGGLRAGGRAAGYEERRVRTGTGREKKGADDNENDSLC